MCLEGNMFVNAGWGCNLVIWLTLIVLYFGESYWNEALERILKLGIF